MSSNQAFTNGNSSLSSSDYFKSIGHQVDQVAPSTTDDDDVKPVEEIESLCMNCHENVCTLLQVS